MTGTKLLLFAVGCVIVFAMAIPVEGQTGAAICSQEGTWIVPSALSCVAFANLNDFPVASKIAAGRSILPLTTPTAGASDASRSVPAQKQRLETTEKHQGAALDQLSSSQALPPNAPSYSSYHPLSGSQKFDLFLQRTSSPDTFLGATFDAGWAQFTNDWPGYGQGMQGFGKRWGAIIADREATSFFGSFLLPTLLHQDPRYFRLGEGPPLLRRLGYALSRVAVTRNDSGHDTFNSSLMGSTLLVSSLSNAYYPGKQRGFSPTMNRFGGSLLGSAHWVCNVPIMGTWSALTAVYSLSCRKKSRGQCGGLFTVQINVDETATCQPENHADVHLILKILGRLFGRNSKFRPVL